MTQMSLIYWLSLMMYFIFMLMMSIMLIFFFNMNPSMKLTNINNSIDWMW